MSDNTEHWSSPNGCAEGCPACAEEAEERITERSLLIAEREAENRVRDAAPALLDALKDALTMAENLRKETGGAREGAICWTLRSAIALTEPPKENTNHPHICRLCAEPFTKTGSEHVCKTCEETT